MVDLRVVGTEELRPGELEALWGLLDASFANSFTRDDWGHTLGGLHVLVLDDGIVGHAAVVERVLVAGERSLRTGYVEGLATRDTHRHRGLGSRNQGFILSGRDGNYSGNRSRVKEDGAQGNLGESEGMDFSSIFSTAISTFQCGPDRA